VTSASAKGPTPSYHDLIDRVCDAFEAELRKGERPRIEDFLAKVPEPVRDGLLQELVGLEIDILYTS
jgi:hypothetical protein